MFWQCGDREGSLSGEFSGRGSKTWHGQSVRKSQKWKFDSAAFTCGNSRGIMEKENPAAHKFERSKTILGLLQAFPRILLIPSNKLAGSARCILCPGALERGSR